MLRPYATIGDKFAVPTQLTARILVISKCHHTVVCLPRQQAGFIIYVVKSLVALKRREHGYKHPRAQPHRLG